MGISIFASAMFTALSDGKTSAIISFGRTFVFLAPAILLLPLVLEADGAWLAVSVAELLGAVVSIFYLIRYRIQ
jgi:Na+-driven multidrug efflux pump